MPKITDNHAVNANTGADEDWADLVPTIHARRIVFDEDPTNGGAVGIDYVLPDYLGVFDMVGGVRSLAAGSQLIFGNVVAQGNNQGSIVGTPGYASGGNTVPATKIAKIRSHGAATKYRISETE